MNTSRSQTSADAFGATDRAEPAAASRSFRRAQAQRDAATAIRGLYSAADGESVFVPKDTYAFEPEAFRTIAMRIGGSGWCSTQRAPGGWRITKGPLPHSRAYWMRSALVRIAEATPANTNSANVDQFISWVRAVALAALNDAEGSPEAAQVES